MHKWYELLIGGKKVVLADNSYRAGRDIDYAGVYKVNFGPQHPAARGVLSLGWNLMTQFDTVAMLGFAPTMLGFVVSVSFFLYARTNVTNYMHKAAKTLGIAALTAELKLSRALSGARLQVAPLVLTSEAAILPEELRGASSDLDCPGAVLPGSGDNRWDLAYLLLIAITVFAVQYVAIHSTPAIVNFIGPELIMEVRAAPFVLFEALRRAVNELGRHAWAIVLEALKKDRTYYIIAGGAVGAFVGFTAGAWVGALWEGTTSALEMSGFQGAPNARLLSVAPEQCPACGLHLKSSQSNDILWTLTPEEIFEPNALLSIISFTSGMLFSAIILLL